MHPEHVSVRGLSFFEVVIMKITDKCNIILPLSSCASAEYAANQLKFYLEKILPRCTVDICSLTSNNTAPQIILGVSDYGSNDDFRIYATDNSVYLKSSTERAIIYAAYAFLELFGCRFFSPDTETIPILDHIKLANDLNITESSPFEYRDIYWNCAFDTVWSLKAKLNGACKNTQGMGRNLPESVGGGFNYAGPFFVHTFSLLVPPSEYFDTHPEYFSEINGQRTSKHLYSQLCMTNKDVISISAKKACQWLRENSDRKMVSISQNDSFVLESYCTCPECKKIIDREGAPSGALIHFVNAVAEEIEKEFPDAIVDTLAYQYSVAPPKYIRPRKNVCVRICTGACNSHPIESCKKNSHVKDAFEKWSSVCNKLYVWDYTTNFAQYLTPYPNLTAIPQNIKFFKEHNVKGLFMQGQYQEGNNGEFGELRSYIMSRLLWNPDTDVKKDMDEFMHAYYGKAAPYIYDYLKFINEKGNNMHAACAFLCKNEWNNLISDDELAFLDKLWLDAASACTDDKSYEHTLRSSMCHIWFKLDSERGEYADNNNKSQLAESFYKNCRELGIEKLSEGVGIPSPQVF